MPDPSVDRLQTLDQDLVIGSRGEDVRAVHGYLAQFGYFPNDRLARDYPSWRPLVAHGPADAAVFDEYSAEAIRRLQHNAQLEETGIVDKSTRAVLREARCGVPEGITEIDPSSKYSVGHLSKVLGSQTIWWLQNDTFGIEHVKIQNAMDAWAGVTDLNFVCGSSNPQIVISHGPLPTEILGQTTINGNQISITINSNKTWMYDTPVSGGQDYYGVILHELGHALGLSHSSWGTTFSGSVMFWNQGPGGKQNFTVDDKVGASMLYDSARQIATGLALDIGVAPVKVNNQEVVWVIGTDGSIWKWDGGDGWIHEVANGDARRIAVDPTGIPYVAAPWGIYRRTSADPFQGTWQQINGNCALDVGVGTTAPDNTTPAVWMVGCDKNVYKFDGLWWNLDTVFPANSASRIAVDRAGTPWVVKDGSQIVYHRSSQDPNSGWYADIPGGAIDIGCAPFPYAWEASVFQAINGKIIYGFDYQDGTPGHADAEWKLVPFNNYNNYNGTTNIAVGPDGDPWWTDAQNRIFRTNK